MITALTKFPLPPGTDLREFRQALVQMAPLFQEPPGLDSKAFLIAEDGASAGGAYLWQSKEQALAFEPKIRRMIKDALGVEAEITYFETPVLVDNIARQIRQSNGVMASAGAR
jgi:hypothetical protein